MKAVLVIGDLNDKLTKVLDKCVSDKVISHYVNYEIYNEVHKLANEKMCLVNASLSNEEFCEMFINTSKDLDEWIFLKGDIHTKDFLHIIIKFEKSLQPLNLDLCLSHIVELVNRNSEGPKSFYLSDAALNTKQIHDRNILEAVISNAQNFIINKKQGAAKIDPELHTSIILAADNSNIPGYGASDSIIRYLSEIPVQANIEIKQFDECFSADAWCIKHKEADAMMFTYPNLLITPDITVGNVIWKSLTILNNWYAKGYVIGGRLNTILLSRSDSEESYYESIKSIVIKNK